MMRVLIITEAGDAWPSGYIRALIYKPLFQKDKIEVHYHSRFSPCVNRLMNSQNRFLKPVLNSGLRTLLWYLYNYLVHRNERKIIKAVRNGYDAIYLQKIYSLQLISAIKNKSNTRLVYDLNDGVWLPRFSEFKDGRLYTILRMVNTVTCDNPYGLKFAEKYNTSLFLVPDPPQVELFDKVRDRVTKKKKPITIGWIGSPNTTFNLFLIWEALENVFSLFDENEIILRLVGVGSNLRNIPPFEKVRFTILPHYSQDEMIEEVLMMDIGLFPLYNVQDSYARGILKSTVYMSGECCVIASPIGQIKDLISDGENGVFAGTSDEWVEKMCLLIKNHTLRNQIAKAGLQTVREQYTIQSCYNHLKIALRGHTQQ